MIKYFLGVLTICTIIFAQNSSSLIKELPADVQQQLIFNKIQNTSNQELSRTLKNTQNKTFGQNPVNDSLLKIDSLSRLKSVKNFDSLSIYEKILRGDTIYPDSILKTLQIFGHDIFNNSQPSTFAPTDNISVPPNYIINPEDEIIILCWGRINEEYRVKVGRDGTINIPRLGPVPVGGLPFSTMQQNILSRIQQIEGVNASVSIGSMRTIGIFIVGEVKSPGYFTISALSNITNALFAAGGPSKNGSMRNIQLKRNKKSIATIDLYDFLLEGNDQTSLRLQAGDVIHVPVIQKLVAITGNVRRSAFYELKGDLTLDKVIELSGGVTPSAWTNTIQIERFSENNRQIVINIDTLNGTIPKFPIFDGDIIKIFPILDINSNAVYLTGNITRPGKYEYKKGMRLSNIIPDYTTLLPETYLEYAIVIRQDPPRFLNRIHTFNLRNALDNISSTDNFVLQQRDNIIIYKLDYFEPDRTIEIDGSVTTPGKFKLLLNMTIRDLILQAGGLRDDASISRGELYRRSLDKNTDLISTTKLDFCVDCALRNDPQHNLLLNRLDRIYIRNKLGWEKEQKITLRGQFNFPGTYILFEGETLGDLIERAGGFKKDAYISAAVFSRVSVKELELQRIQEYSNQLESDILNLSAEIATKENPAEAQAMLNQQIALKNNLSNSKATGRVVIDLTETKNTTDFILEDGDDLFIPRNFNTISVMGEVYNPATLKFETNISTVSHLIETAGGIKNSGDNKHIYIIKANGTIITNKNNHILSIHLEPGDAVVVPQKIRYSNPQKVFVDTVDAVFKISSLLATIVTLIIALNTFK